MIDNKPVRLALDVEALLVRLRDIKKRGAIDEETDHYDADLALLEYIDDPRVTAAFDTIEKWYA